MKCFLIYLVYCAFISATCCVKLLGLTPVSPVNIFFSLPFLIMEEVWLGYQAWTSAVEPTVTYPLLKSSVSLSRVNSCCFMQK